MLTAKRFDCFARGINEAWAEKEVHKKSNFDIDPHLVLVYRAPIYFFVRKSDIDLAERIERGLRIAIKDGSFDEVFKKYQNKYLELANIKSRSIIFIKKTTLPESTPTTDESLWLDTFRK
ncbi:hypothetical protein N9W79_01840 [bacterium]|nr:hypothetical protein [bacterium]